VPTSCSVLFCNFFNAGKLSKLSESTSSIFLFNGLIFTEVEPSAATYSLLFCETTLIEILLLLFFTTICHGKKIYIRLKDWIFFVPSDIIVHIFRYIMGTFYKVVLFYQNVSVYAYGSI
jgi:hypothetical protein